jgi:hypothetical protein
MLQLSVARPAGDGLLSDLLCFSQPAQLEKAQYKAAVGLQIVRRDLPGMFEAGGGTGIVVSVQGGVAASE